ncbi:MAG: VOC family protein [Sandaracinaceae bacterium]|nr:VOC family protein [Sandaracinaceae bacterium]
MTNRFVWAELVTAQQGDSSEFYRSLFGWQAEEMNMGEAGTYLIMKAGEAQVGGIAASPQKVPTHWLSYLTVDDVDATASKIEGLGGQLQGKPFDIPNIGRAVIATDPNGAAFAAFTPASSDGPTPSAEPPLHSVCWREVLAEDVDAAVAFYQGITDWTTEAMGPDVVIFKSGDTQVGTIRKMPEMAKGGPSHWMHYFLVEDTEASTKRAAGLGAKVLMPGMEIPGLGRFSVVADPTGGVFALWTNAAQP